MRLIRTLHVGAGWLAAIAVTAVFGSLGIILGALFPRSDLALELARHWAHLCLTITGSRLSIEGLENIDLSSRYVVMANHESTLDIPTLLVALPPELGVRFLAKKSLFAIPIVGRAMRAMRFIPVDREDRSTARDMFDQALEQIRMGRSVLIFPEATRTPDGRLLPFKRGGFLIALRSGISILPVGLEGPRLSMADGKHSFRPEQFVVRFGEPIPTEGMGISARRDLTARCRQAIDHLRGPRGHIADE